MEAKKYALPTRELWRRVTRRGARRGHAKKEDRERTKEHLAGEGAEMASHEERSEEVGSRPHGGGGQLSYGKGHRVARTGTVAWCVRCGAHAEARIGVAMSRECTPILESEKSGRAYRRSLLLRGLHPITKKRLA